MNVVYLGSGEFGLPCLDALAASRHNLSLLVTQPARGSGRGRKTCATAVCRWAHAYSVPNVETENVNTPELVARIAACQPDVIVVIAFGQKIGPELVALPPRGAINVHASLLPKYRGAAPINWAIVQGQTHTGISIITLADKIDAGDILGQSQTEIGTHETAGELHDRLAKLSAPLLLDTLAKLAAGTATYIKQNDAEATFASKLCKADGLLDFGEPAPVLSCKVRGFWPWPGAAACHVSKETQKSTRVTLALADVIWGPNPAGSVPGTFDEDLNLICGEGKLSIMKIKPAGSGLMEFRDFINGWRVRPGDRLTKVDG